MSELLFIRHAETDMAGTFCGHSDPPVNTRGHEQIQELFKSLSAERFAGVYSSDLQRAVTTAEALAKRFSVPLATTLNLREIGFGRWEGLFWTDVEQKDSVHAQQWTEAYPHLPAPGGEDFDAFQARVLDEVQHLLALAGDKTFAVVTHAGVMRTILRSLCGLNERAAWQQTASYCSFFKYTPEVSQ
jgi:broad specificity phosphatase PhoE